MFSEKIISLAKQLYPTGRAFKMAFGGFFDGLHTALSISETKAYEDALWLLNNIIPDNDNFTIDDAADWERRLGLITNDSISLADRKLSIKRKMNFPGNVKSRQSALFLKSQLQSAGFNVDVFENRYFGNVFSNELTNDPTLTNNGLWYQGTTGNNAIYINNGAAYLTSMIDRTFSTTDILEVGKSYYVDVTISFLGAGGTIVFSSNEGTIYTANSAGNFTFTFTKSTSFARLFATASSGSNATISYYSVKEVRTGYYSKPPLEVSGGVGLKEIQHGNYQHGDIQHGYIFANKVVNYIDESLDENFDVGDNFDFTFFITGPDFNTILGDMANIDINRKDEFRQLILKAKPLHSVAYLLVNYV